MKRLVLFLMAAFLLSLSIPSQMNAAVATGTPVPTAVVSTDEADEADVLLARLDEIKAIDKSGMSSVERKELRKEVRAIKSELNAIGGGVYISVGAALIIILLLIILL